MNKTLIIKLENMREEGLLKFKIDVVIKLLKVKFKSKLKRANLKYINKNISYEIVNLKNGFKVILIGPQEEIKKEYKLIELEFNELSNKKGGDLGYSFLISAGLSFLYYIEEQKGGYYGYNQKKNKKV